MSIDRSECTGIWTVIAREAEALWSASSLILNEAICRAFACAKLGSIASIPDDLLAACAR
ncbi:hypothetical protein [Chitinilyticum aquatile]|uniref:hypothetical protein n=1 Tax=Chitinilyticum aquatile TaxID=362520 RepID=UPI0004155627|nr:hypothetical protein [Chitinilyticum aquatile]